MDKGKYQPWYHESFMSDPRVRRMTPIAAKTYMMLLHEAFVCSTRPNLPDDEEELEMLACCTDKEEWLSVRETVLKMFSKDVIDGVSVLTNKRLTKDWEHLQEIREARSEAGKASAAKRKSTNVQQDSTNVDISAQVSKEVSKQVNEGEEMKADKQIAVLSQQAFGKSRTRLYGKNQEGLNLLILAHKGSAVIRAFSEWVEDNEDDPDISDALAAFLNVSDDYLSAEPRGVKIAQDPKIDTLVGELAFACDNTVGFDDRAKVRLSKSLETYTQEEIVAVFKEWFEKLDTSNPKDVSFGGKNFSERADQFLYSARKRKQEKEQEETKRAAMSKYLQEQAETARQEAEKKRAEEENSFDPLADVV